ARNVLGGCEDLGPRICMQDELTGVPINRATRFENRRSKADFGEILHRSSGGESAIKERAPPDKIELGWALNKIERAKSKIKGFIIEKRKRILNNQFTVENINPKKKNIVKHGCKLVLIATGMGVELVTIPYVIHLTNELAREDFQSGCIWQEFVDELELIVHSPLDQFEIIPLISMKIGNLYFSFTNPSFLCY
ncbi:hypothetical protein H5410_001693, partial [Solanum commersonii]